MEDIKSEVYLNVANELAKLSKDQNTQVGCVIVDKNGKVVSTGRNGPISGINDSKIPHSREERTFYFSEIMGGTSETCEIKCNKYPFYIHAEANALLFCDNRDRLIGSTVYITGMPCYNCTLLMAQSKVARVVIPEDGGNIKMMDKNACDISKYLLLRSNIEFYRGKNRILLHDVQF